MLSRAICFSQDAQSIIQALAKAQHDTVRVEILSHQSETAPVLTLFQSQIKTTSVPADLTQREKEVLQLLVLGKSYKMIASELSITDVTVGFDMKNIYEKLHVTSMTEAVAKAIQERII